MVISTNVEEIVSFHRRGELAGVEIRNVKNSARAFRCYSADFEFFAPITWRGEVWHRRRQTVLGPGSVLCAHPGEVFLARRVLASGSASFVTIDARVFHEYLAKHARPAGKLQLRPFTNLSKRLRERLFTLIEVVRPGPSAPAIERAMQAFVTAMVEELLEDACGAPTTVDAGMRAAHRVRECLHDDASSAVDLTTLAKQAGVSRFQALRMFKRRYGLPPHTYQLSVRLALAQKALREGQQPAQVAAEFGFVDQSHLTRHFKRFLGVTPAQYARAQGEPLPNASKPGTPMSARSQLGGSFRFSARKSTVARTLVESCRPEG